MIFRSKTIGTILIVVAVMLVVGAGYIYVTSNSEVPRSEIADEQEIVIAENENGQEIENSVDAPEGWEIYTDKGLGYGFAYPQNWNLSFEAMTKGLQKGRQEQLILTNGNTEVLIDPLGRRGASEFPNPVEVEDVTVGNITWEHIYWQEGNYHRFTDINETLKLDKDPTTNGIQAIGGREEKYDFKSNFRVHVTFVDSSDRERQETLQTVSKILETLATSQGHL